MGEIRENCDPWRKPGEGNEKWKSSGNIRMGLASMFVSQVAGSLCRSSSDESQQEFPSIINSSFNQITAYEIKLSKDNHPFSYPNAIC